MIKNKFAPHYKKILFLLSFFFFFFTVGKTFADEACSPYDCIGSGAYLKINTCNWSGVGLNCLNGDSTPNYPFSCPTGGPAGSCTGFAEGVNGCTGLQATPGSSSCTTCSGQPLYNYQCANSAQGTPCGSGYTGTCTGCTTMPPVCPAPASGTRGCCNVTSTPPPTPPPNQENCYQCASGSCSLYTVATGTCSTNCAACAPGSTPPPPPGQENCYQCASGSCSLYTVATGTCSTNCAACTASCSVSLSPTDVNLFTDSNPFNITANVSNVQGGAVTQVEFSKSNNNINMDPAFDADGSPYQSYIHPVTAGTTTLTANVRMGSAGVVCSASTTVAVTVNTQQTDEAPDCEDFTVTNPSITQGESAHYIAEITDDGFNLLTNGGFEMGNMTEWTTAHELNEWWAVPNFLPGGYPSPGAEGAYYAKISRAVSATDPHSATGWIEAGENLTNQQYTLKFLGKSHEASKLIQGILIQRHPYGSDWTGTGVWAGWPTFTHTAWNEFSYNLTFPNPGNGSNTSQLRVILRPPQDAWPVYYDSVKIFKTSSAGVDPTTVQFYSIPNSSDPCVGSNWTLIGNGTRIGSTNYYEVTWNTTLSTPAGQYTIAVNSRDVQGNQTSGNPGNCGNPAFTYRPACNGPQTITACAPSCGGTSCGNTANTPGAPGNFRVNGVTSGNIDLTSSPNLTFSWDQASITAPSTINQYEVRIWDTTQGTAPTVVGAPCNQANGCRSYIVNGTTFSTTQAAHYYHTNNVRAAVRAINNTCAPVEYGNWSTVRTYNLVAQVSGTIYDLATGPNGSNNCVGTGSVLDISTGFLSMVSSTGGNITTAPGANYIMSNIPYAPSASWTPDHNFSLTLNLDSSDPANTFYCSCPGGTPFSCIQTNTIAPSSAQNFFLTAIDLSNNPWWQSRGGNIYAAQGYTSNVPDTASSYLVTRHEVTDLKSAGAPMSGGSVTANGYWTAYNGTTQPRANNTSHANIVKEDYDYLIRNVNVSTIPQQLPATISSFNFSAQQQRQFGDALVSYRDGDLTIDFTSSTTRVIAAGTKQIVFVNGNVTITGTNTPVGGNHHRVRVENGGYLSIIAKGNITIGANIGNRCTHANGGCDSTNPNLDGVLIASERLIIADDGVATTPDRMFIGNGTFVGWNGISLNRSFDNTGNPLDRSMNNTYPTTSFRFRPDLTTQTPEILQRPNLVWQEVN